MAADKSKRTILVLSQVYVPDPAAVGQQMADAAEELVRRGYTVRVLTSARGYDDPTVRYPARETRDGVAIVRLPFSSFGKKTILHRLMGQSFFLLQTLLRGCFTRCLSGILVSTSPPMCSIAAVMISFLRGVKMTYWVMDVNPDQMIVLDRLGERSLPARVFNAINKRILKQADEVVVLDRFMADRINRKVDVSHKMTILPPWPLEKYLGVVAHDENPFREEHGLDGKFVIMYSGNHGYSTPVTTVLQAALRLQDDKDLVFVFIGGGVGKQEVEQTIAEHRPGNIISLPYQPLESLRYSLSAADVHVVTVGESVVGVVHPCKIYGAMSVARPILLVAPDPCHVSDLVEPSGIGWHIQHGDLETAVETIRRIRNTDRETLARMGQEARHIIEQRFSKTSLLGQFADVVERGL